MNGDNGLNDESMQHEGKVCYTPRLDNCNSLFKAIHDHSNTLQCRTINIERQSQVLRCCHTTN